jgi:hypothetical protein
MGKSRSFEQRARAEVERIKAQDAAEEGRKQERMRELARQAEGRRETAAAEERRLQEERNAKLRRSREEMAVAEERLARDSARRGWIANGGTEEAFEGAWPSMWSEMLVRRTVDADTQARQGMWASNVSRI